MTKHSANSLEKIRQVRVRVLSHSLCFSASMWWRLGSVMLVKLQFPNSITTHALELGLGLGLGLELYSEACTSKREPASTHKQACTSKQALPAFQRFAAVMFALMGPIWGVRRPSWRMCTRHPRRRRSSLQNFLRNWLARLTRNPSPDGNISLTLTAMVTMI